MKLPLEPTIIDDKIIDTGKNLRGEVLEWPEDNTRSVNDGKRDGRKEEERNVNERGGRLDPTTDTEGETETPLGDGTAIEQVAKQIEESDVLKEVENAMATKSLSDFVRVMNNILSLVNNDQYKDLHNYTAETRLNIAESLYNQAYNLALQQYNNQYAYSLWLMQQEYNSPLKQKQRLEEAGLAGAWSQIASNTAQGVAGSDEGTAMTDEGWGNTEATVRNAKKDRILKGIETAISLGTNLVSGYTALKQLKPGIEQMRSAAALNMAQVKQIQDLTPQELKNLMATQELIESQKGKTEAEKQGQELETLWKKTTWDFAKNKLIGEVMTINRINNLHDLEIANFNRNLNIKEEQNRIAGQATANQYAVGMTQAGASMINTERSAQATEYAARENASAYRAGGILQYASHYHNETMEEVAVDNETGVEIDAGTSAKLPGFAKCKVGGSFEYGHKKLTKKIRTKRLPSELFDGMNIIDAYNLYQKIGQDMPTILSREAADAYTRPIWQGEWVK